MGFLYYVPGISTLVEVDREALGMARTEPPCGGTRLPRVLGLSPDGEPVEKVVEEFAALNEHAESLFRELVETNDFVRTYDEAEGIGVAALSANYCIGRWETRALGLLTTANMRKILWALVPRGA